MRQWHTSFNKKVILHRDKTIFSDNCKGMFPHLERMYEGFKHIVINALTHMNNKSPHSENLNMMAQMFEANGTTAYSKWYENILHTDINFDTDTHKWAACVEIRAFVGPSRSTSP